MLPTDLNRIEGNINAIETGSRTIDPAQSPSSNSGSLRQWLDWLPNMIKKITGKTNWYDNPDTTLAAAKTHIDATSAHSATSAAAANRIILRDASGRAQVASPSAAADIATKGYVDSNINAIETGSRTIDPAQSPSGNEGSLRQILSWLANRIRAITGMTNWYDAPPATLSGLNTSLSSHKSATPIDHPDGSVTIAKLAASTMTSAGGTEPNRLARTDASGAVGLATNALLLKGRDIAAIVDHLYWSFWPSRASGTTHHLWGIAYGGGMWVAVGLSGTILTSTNGTSWTSRTSGTSYLWGIAYGGGMWVVVGLSGRILTSTNGISWTTRTSGTSENLYGIAYDGGMWVAVGRDGTIMTSTNVTSWTSRSSGTTEDLQGVAYGDGMWVAVGSDGTIIGTVPT